MKSLSEAVAGSSLGRSCLALGRVQRNCDRHGPYMALGHHFTRMDRDIWGVCPTCAVEADRRRAADERAAAASERADAARARIEEAIEHAAIPERFKRCTLDNFVERTELHGKALRTARRFVGNWDIVRREGRWMVFAGGPGVGKSHLANAVLQALMPGHIGQYITLMAMVQAIRATWDKRGEGQPTETEVLRHFGTVPLLVVDEIGVQYGTAGEQTLMFDVLDRRYRDMKPTILLTNEDLDGLREFIGPRLFDRLRECATWVAFDGESARADARTGSLQ